MEKRCLVNPGHPPVVNLKSFYTNKGQKLKGYLIRNKAPGYVFFRIKQAGLLMILALTLTASVFSF